MIEVEVVGVRVEPPDSQPIVLLRETDGTRVLPIWVGTAEAAAIANGQQGVQSPRPMTHDLLVAVIEALDACLAHVEVVDVVDGVFHARLVFSDGTSVSSRSSDAIAVALRVECPVLVSTDVLDRAAVEVDLSGEDPGDGEVSGAEDEVERFREFLEKVTPEDFERPPGADDDPSRPGK